MDQWPELPLDKWQGTYDTLHMWTQIVGKICLKLTPLTNHYWNIAFQVGANGLHTYPMRYENRTFTIFFDLIEHRLCIVCSDGGERLIRLESKSVAQFYRELMETLHEMGIDVKIWTMPVEYANPIRFEKDETHHEYDPIWATKLLNALLSMKPVMEDFRCSFVGKCSPVHFFWGSFDLAVTRFSGKRAPARPEMGAMYAEAYSHEVISHGWWPGGAWPVGEGLRLDEAVFYAYAAPSPPGFADAKVEPASAYYDDRFYEFFLPYEKVRTSNSPEADLTEFMQSTYDAAANLAKWNRSELER